MTTPIYAVIATHNKHQSVYNLVTKLKMSTDAIVVIDNASDTPLTKFLRDKKDIPNLHIIEDDEQPPNLSRLWNVGLNLVEKLATEDAWDVAVLNDDITVSPFWIRSLSDQLRNSDAAVAYGDQFNRDLIKPQLFTEAKPISLYDRMCGYAHIAKGELGIRFDETMRWWYSDDDYDWTCRLNGGSLLVPGHTVIHDTPGESTNASLELSTQAGIDRETFYKKWNQYPW